MTSNEKDNGSECPAKDIDAHLASLLTFSRELRKNPAFSQNAGDVIPVLFPLMTLLEECDHCIKILYQKGEHMHSVTVMQTNAIHLSLLAIWGWLEQQAALPEPHSTDMLRLDGDLLPATASRSYLLVRSLIASFVIFEGIWKACVAAREGQEDAIDDQSHAAVKLMDGILSLKAPNKLFLATCKLKSRMAADPSNLQQQGGGPAAAAAAASSDADLDPIVISDDWFFQVRPTPCWMGKCLGKPRFLSKATLHSATLHSATLHSAPC